MTAQPYVRLGMLPADELARDELPGEPFRMEFPGYWRVGPDGVLRRSDISVRMNSADIADLKAQIRAAEMAYVSRITRLSPEEIKAEQARAAVVAQDGERPTVELLHTLLVKLRAA